MKAVIARTKKGRRREDGSHISSRYSVFTVKKQNSIRSTSRLFGRIPLLFLSLLLILVHQSCLGPLPSSRPVCGNCENQDHFVRLEKVNADFLPDLAPPFSHPFKLAPNEWTEIFSTLYVQKLKPGFLIWGGKENKEPAFTEEEIHYLSTTLPQAFEQAQPDEMVVYALSQSPFSNISEISTGGLFVKNNDLIVVLSNHRYAVSLPGIREMLWEHPLRSEGVLYDLVGGDHQTIRKQNLFEIQPTPLRMTIAYKALLFGTPEPSNPDSELSKSASPADQQSSKRSIEANLAMLNRLKTQGLITEDEFQQKKKELLDRI